MVALTMEASSMTMRRVWRAWLSGLRTNIGLPFSSSIDEPVDGGGVGAALLRMTWARLAGERREGHLSVDALCEFTGERGLAGADVTVQAEHLFIAGAIPL